MSDYRTARGWLRKEERELLVGLASQVPESGTVVNIGVEFGSSIICLMTGAPQSANVVGIDIHLAPYQGPQYPNRSFYLMEGRSVDVLEEWGHPIDLLFVDGDHSRQGILDDLLWVNYLKQGGVVAFHDCHDYADPTKPHGICPEVNEEVEKWYQTNKAILTELAGAGTIRVFGVGLRGERDELQS